MENRNCKFVHEINQLKENLIELSEKNTELISELETLQLVKAKIHKASFHSVEKGI